MFDLKASGLAGLFFSHSPSHKTHCVPLRNYKHGNAVSFKLLFLNCWQQDNDLTAWSHTLKLNTQISWIQIKYGNCMSKLFFLFVCLFVLLLYGIYQIAQGWHHKQFYCISWWKGAENLLSKCIMCNLKCHN